MKQTNLSVFITHKGCPHLCSFCNQKEINESEPVTPEALRSILSEQLEPLRAKETKAEIAFFGGSFTAISRDYMESLLSVAREFITAYPEVYDGIRCSTRPDCIDDDVLSLLKRYGMTAIELGAQSMSDGVLSANRRGHTSDDVRNASRLIKQYGFSLGLQMMTGLYTDTVEGAYYTAEEFIKLKPDTVRIYPTVVLRNTELGRLFLSGEYQTLTFEETVELCSELLNRFENAGIKVIRLGLHRSEGIESNMLGGVFHPAFREICESRNIYNELSALMIKSGGKRFIIHTDKTNISKIIGQGGENREKLSALGFSFRIKEERGTRLRIEVI